MLILDLTTGRFSEPDADPQDNYPDEVLESEWNPVLSEIQSVQRIEIESSKSAPEVIDAALEWLDRN